MPRPGQKGKLELQDHPKKLYLKKAKNINRRNS